jgi:alpha-ribazole phosphatase
MRLWLIRHAVTAAAPGLCYGSLDLEADSHATHRAAAQLAEALPRGLAIRTSPLKRCVQLGEELHSLRPDLPHALDSRLREMDFGSWEGRSWDDIGASAMSAWTSDFWNHRPGGGESVQDLMNRVAAVWDSTRAIWRDTLWITHAGVIRAARLLAQGKREVQSASDWPQHAVAFGSWEVLELQAPLQTGRRPGFD